MPSVFTRAFVPSALFSVLLAACGGSDGDVCQINDDCSSSLICCKSSPSAPLTERGSCAATCMFVASDASVADASARDASPADAAVSDDASSVDDSAVPVDAAETPDAAPVLDASEIDSATPADASETADASDSDAG